MKIFLLFVFLITTSRAAPAELAFLENLLPDSSHVYTQVVGMVPTGVIVVQYKGDDKIETAVNALNKALGVNLQEISAKDQRLDLLLLLTKSPSNQPVEHKRFQADGVAVDIAITRRFYEGDGTRLRFISIHIARKGP